MKANFQIQGIFVILVTFSNTKLKIKKVNNKFKFKKMNYSQTQDVPIEYASQII